VVQRMVECDFRDIRRVSRHGERLIEQVCLIGARGPVTIGFSAGEADERFCSKCEVPSVMSTEHCKHLAPRNHFALGGEFHTDYECRYWNEYLGYKKEALEKCSKCKDYSAI